MANVQPQFEAFHKRIKIDKSKQLLIDKRETLKKDLESNLEGEGFSVIDYILQGSYAINTGIKPFDGDYDIDVGVVVDVDEDYDPIKLKRSIRDALNKRYKRTVNIRNPCVTVEYLKAEKRDYHVDLPIYRQDGTDYYLAWGKEFASSDNVEWRLSDPKGLVENLNARIEGNSESAQCRRVVKYLKWWRNHVFSSVGNGAPVSIGLTLQAFEHFDYKTNYEGKERDLLALLHVVEAMIASFDWFDRITAEMPVEPYDNVFGRMSRPQMQNFKEKLEKLKTALEKADDEEDAYEAAKLLQKQFGSQFPVPLKTSTAKRVGASIATTGNMA